MTADSDGTGGGERATISDVARLAGVSKATVSRVLNDSARYMRPDTAERVRRAIDQLGYRPNTAARSLTLRRSDTLALMVSDVANPFYADVIHGVEDAALERGYTAFLCNTNYDLERGLTFLRSLIDKRVDGVLLMSSSMADGWLDELARAAIPAVVLDWATVRERPRVATVKVDFEPGIADAVAHLVAQGRTRLGHLTGPLSLATGRARRDAFRRASAAQGIAPERIVEIEGDLRSGGGRAALPGFVGAGVEALFCSNDLMALGALTEARRRGVRIPDDLAVVGLDDIAAAADSDPPLSSVALPRYQIGALAVERLFALLDGGGAEPAAVATRFVARESSADTSEEASP